MDKRIAIALFPLISFAGDSVAFGEGIFINERQINYVRDNLHSQPWRGAYERAVKDSFATKNYVPTPWLTVECGAYSNPNYGCDDETRDASAAYTQAIMWRMTSDETYAQNAVKILNAWANTLKGGHTNHNGPLQAAWSATLFSRAASIIRDSYDQWSIDEIKRVSMMFDSQFSPDLDRMFTGSYACFNKNWHASAIEAMLNIAVFNKNKMQFDRAVDKWRSLVPSYIYLETDGKRPKDAFWCTRNESQTLGYWNNPVSYVDGLAQESCRDFEHTAYGLAAIINTAETARINGVDLYQDSASQAKLRLTKTMELHSAYQIESGSKLCVNYEGYKLNTIGTFEVGFNHYALREGISLPYTERFLEKTRPTKGKFHYLWETLTHGLVGNIGD
ncbi:alginate lyase family protein [Aeromonas sp. SG16]|uniref:alginate lyase family protein n=1 Tax=Aeromonas sp. SG16 TaxID=2950548 RepID=UPI00210A1EE7|nr:alginate lyase family protein [Aeromonas sp. SG16]MCQ4054427.1 alginate lyase family protein [Aeromonas sp. SG16]